MRAGTQLQADDDERTEVFRYENMADANIEEAPDTERELTPLGEDEDDVEMTLPFRRRPVAPASFVKPKRVIVIGPAIEPPPPAPAPPSPVSNGPRTLRMNAIPVAPHAVPRAVQVHEMPAPAMAAPVIAAPAMPIFAASAYAAPLHAAMPSVATKRAARWPFFAAAALLIGVTGVGVFFARNARLFDRAPRASAPTASAQMPAVTTPSAAASIAADPPSIDPATIPTLSASPPPPAPSASIARRPIARPPAWPRPVIAPVAVAPTATTVPSATVAAPAPSAEPLDLAALPATGKLTVICVPGCDQVFDGGRPLGASPVFKIVTNIGVHHLTLVTNDPPMKKQIDVNVVEDETAVVRAEMK